MKKINISIDDVSPHPRSSIKVVENCKKIISCFPSAKFTFFVPTGYWRTLRPNVATSSPLLLSEHLDFCNELKQLSKNNFEIAYHGHYHGIPGKSDNDEVKDINYDDCVALYENMFQEAKKAGIYNDFKKIFRPPAWRMSPEAFKASKSVGIEILALTEKDYAKDSYKGEDLQYKNVTYSNIYPPFKNLHLKSDKTGIVYHACDWDKNYLSAEKTDELIKFLQNCNEEIEFVFMDGIV